MRSSLFALVLLAWSAAPAQEPLSAELREEVVKVPLTLDGLFGKSEVQLTATLFRPPGTGPFPLVVLSHGSPANAGDRPNVGRYRKLSQIGEFTRRSFAVIVPIRRGFGDTGGTFAEDYGSCDAPEYFHAGLEAAKDVIAAMEYAQKLPFVDRERVLLVGQSAGGFASLAAASRHPPGLIGVVNFAGGRGGNPKTRPGEPCRPGRMADAVGRYAQTIQVPVLWHYAQNDLFFAPTHVRAWFQAFERTGARGRLVIQPPFGKDGHGLFTSDQGLPIWTAEFDKFIAELGFATRPTTPIPASLPR